MIKKEMASFVCNGIIPSLTNASTFRKTNPNIPQKMNDFPKELGRFGGTVSHEKITKLHVRELANSHEEPIGTDESKVMAERIGA